MRQLLKRLMIAATLRPTARGWLWIAQIALLYGAIAIPLGFASGFLKWELAISNRIQFVLEAFFLFVTPALVEEVFFRVLLLPHPTESLVLSSWLFWAAIGLLLFLVYHPLNAISLYPPGYPLFFQPMFLLLAGLLGIACTVAYALTGSLWGIVLIHWLVVMVWLFCLGGKGNLGIP